MATTIGLSNSNEEEIEVRRGPWTLEEDTLLIHYIAHHGEGQWNLLAKLAGLKRTGKSCRLRWLNYLKPDVKRGNLTPQEQLLILELHSKWGNRWSKIAQYLPGRTDNEIKNYWRTRVQKQARQPNIESNSKTFIDAARFLWMPRLLQKVEQTSPSSTFPSPSLDTMDSHNSISPSDLSLDHSLPLSSPSPSNIVYAFNHPSENSCHVTSTSTLLSNVPQNPTCQSHAIGNSMLNTHLLNDSFDIDGLNLTPYSEMGNLEISDFDCQMASSNWVLDNMDESLWNIDSNDML